MPNISAVFRNQHGEGEELQGFISNFQPIGLHIEKIPPSADCLRQQHPGSHHIQQTKKGNLPSATKSKCRQCAPDNPAIDGQPAIPYGKDAPWMSRKGIPCESHIIQPSTDDATRDQPQC